MSERYSVIFLSEDLTLLEETEKQLSQQVDYFRANFASEAESKALSNNANLIAIDSRIAGNRGHEICEEFKNQKETSHIAILLLAHTKGIDEKIKALAIGCDQTIYYPDSGDSVLEKVEQAIDHREKQQKQSLNRDDNSGFITSFNYNQFYDACFDCETGDDLANLFMSGAHQLKLDCAIQIRMKDKRVDVELTGTPSEIDSLLLAHLKPQTETMPLGTSMVVNRPKVGAMVKHMPLGNFKHYDFIQETLEAMLDTINTQVEQLDFQPDEASTVNPAKELMAIAGIIYSFLSKFQSAGASEEDIQDQSTELLAKVKTLLAQSDIFPKDEEKVLGPVKDYIDNSILNFKNKKAYGDNELGNLMEMLRSVIIP